MQTKPRLVLLLSALIIGLVPSPGDSSPSVIRFNDTEVRELAFQGLTPDSRASATAEATVAGSVLLDGGVTNAAGIGGASALSVADATLIATHTVTGEQPNRIVATFVLEGGEAVFDPTPAGVIRLDVWLALSLIDRGCDCVVSVTDLLVHRGLRDGGSGIADAIGFTERIPSQNRSISIDLRELGDVDDVEIRAQVAGTTWCAGRCRSSFSLAVSSISLTVE